MIIKNSNDYDVITRPSVPNQRIIRIPNRIVKTHLVIDMTALNTAIATLGANSFKLWLYFYKSAQNIDMPLWSKDFIEWSKTSDSTYDRAFKELKEKGYLVSTSRRNYYVFVDNPQSVQDSDYIDMNDNTTSGSRGELKIAKILTDNKIDFIREATFGTCLFEDTGYPARFDFYINNEYLIEFDGVQHFENKYGYWTMEEGWFEKIQARDKFKNEWCKENNIPLIRIPYTRLDELCLKDLKLETTDFRIV